MLIAITANASPARGNTEAEVTEMMDLFDDVLEGQTTSKTVDRMLEILDAGKPITASMRAHAKRVRLDPLAKLTDRFWRDYRAKHPQPKRAKRTAIHVSIARRRG